MPFCLMDELAPILCNDRWFLASSNETIIILPWISVPLMEMLMLRMCCGPLVLVLSISYMLAYFSTLYIISMTYYRSLTEVCRLPLDYGGCSSFLPRWYYNTEKRRCEQFLYGGCFGNSNRFLSKKECDNACTHNDVCGLPKPVSLKRTI